MMNSSTSKSQQHHQNDRRERKSTHSRPINRPTRPPVWYCPSRWLLAHHDSQANIETLSSHMCLADLNNDGDSLLALIDFKQHQLVIGKKSSPGRPPYDCRMRVYRGQQLIYNHFLEDIPSCLIATSINLPQVPAQAKGLLQQQDQLNRANFSPDRHQPLLTIAINDDIYFYHKLKPSHRVSLEDEDFILNSLNKSEVDIWQMVKQKKVDVEAMRELLFSLSQELGGHELTSHSINFLALKTSEARRQYLMSWKFKKLQNGFGEHLMSMDTICCSAARLKYGSPVTRSGDFGQTRETGSFLNNTRWNRILDIQRDGLVIGTEDRHLLIYELRSIKTRLEYHTRLPSVPDHILVERCSPSGFDPKLDLKDMSYKILISCRNCRIYSMDCLYIMRSDGKPAQQNNEVKELIRLKCNVLDMSWTTSFEEINQQIGGGGGGLEALNGQKDFIVACLDRRVYCYNSRSGVCRWLVEVEMPITSIISLPKLQANSSEGSLVGVGCQANRIDFYVSSTGRIVDSIYLSQNDYPQAMTFGRFGREDNCLCLVTNLGHLLIFILKRTAKFAHGQCLSSAASYASDAVASCSQILLNSRLRSPKTDRPLSSSPPSTTHQQPAASSTSPSQANKPHHQVKLKLNEPASLPSAFSLSKSSSTSAADQVLDSVLQSEHDCNQVMSKGGLDAQLLSAQMQVPAKGRDFVDQILEQSRGSRLIGRTFAQHMLKLTDKIKSTIEQSSELNLENYNTTMEDGNRVSVAQVTGLGNIYRVGLAIRLNLASYFESKQARDSTMGEVKFNLVVQLFGLQSSRQTNSQRFQITPTTFTTPIDAQSHATDDTLHDSSSKVNRWLVERLVEFKLTLDNQNDEMAQLKESASLEVCILIKTNEQCETSPKLMRPIHVSTISIPSC